MPTRGTVQRALQALQRLYPADGISCADADRFAVSQDLWPRNILRMYHGHNPQLPAAVVWPRSVDDIQRVLAWANQHDVSLVPYGAGSGVVGGTTVTADQVVLDTKRMHRVRHIDTAAQTCTAEAGVMGELLERQLQRARMSQGHFPSSIYCSTLGGWLATRSAGQASCRYGKIEDQVLGGVAVLGDGTAVQQVARPGVSNLFTELTGNEGVLGIWAEATLRIHPTPPARGFAAFDFPDLTRAIRAARGLLLAGATPSILRIYDPLDTLLHRDTHGQRVHRDRGPSRSAALGAFVPRLVSAIGGRLSHQCRCIIITEGEPAVVEHDAVLVADLAQAHGGRPLGPGPARAWYHKRYAVSYRMSNVFRAGVAVDTMEVACPWERLMPVYEAVKRAGLACGAQVMAHFSHLYLEGGSIYFTFAMPAAGGESAYDRLWEATLNAAIGHGANVSHHHGIGQLKSAGLRRAWGDYGAALHRLRRVCDPNQILNPATLAMHSAASATVPMALPEVGPHARWAVAKPDDTLRGLETRLAAHGQTLGRVATLFPHMTMLQGARRGLLWRLNSQLGVIEPLVMGVDANIDRARHRFVAAPRGAQGPDLQATLLAQVVTRLWLRSAKAPVCSWRATSPVVDAVAVVQRLVQHPLAQKIQCVLQWRGDGHVDVLLAAEHEHPTHAALINACLPDAVREPGAATGTNPCDDDAVRFVATWQDARVHLAAGFGGSTRAFAWADAAGLLGFVDATTHGAMTPEIFGDGVTRFAAPTLSEGPSLNEAPHALETPRSAASEAAPPAMAACRLRARQTHRAALDNCTFCPKLCRFACPVTTATGNEAHIPRQMMLSARLDVAGQRPLNASVARTLYSCVDCRGCRTFCDHDNDVATVLQHTRAELWGTDLVPPAVREVCEALASTGAMPASCATGAIASLPSGTGDATALFLACQNDADSAAAIRGAHALTQARHGATQIIDGGKQCCGHPLLRWGHREGFVAHATRFAAGISPAVQLLVVDDPGCAYTLGTLYREVADVAMPLVTWVADLVPPATVAPSLREHALHDACFATRWLGAPALRDSHAAHNRAPGSVLEGGAGCCGGMLLPFHDAKAADAVARGRVADLQGGSNRRIVSPSPTCSRRMRQVHAPVDDLLALWHRHGAPRQGANFL